MSLAALVCLLGACEGERPADGAAPATQASPSSPADSDPAAPPPLAAEPPAPPVAAGDSAPGDSTAALRSVYTSLAEAGCRRVSTDEETGSTSSRCPGAAGYALLVHDFDARMTVDVVAPDGRTSRLRYSAVITSAFSSLGPRAEWRMRGETPTALIVRVNAFEDPSAPERATSYLAVARITSREICVTDRIPPGAQANEAARQAADGSASRPCRRDLR